MLNITADELRKKHVFIPRKTSEGDYWVEETRLDNRICDSAEECTSPKGVMPRLHVDGCQLRRWEYDGRSALVEEFETEVEAEDEWLLRTYEYDYLNSDLALVDCDTEDEAIQSIADTEDVDFDTAKSMVDASYEKFRKMAAEIAGRLMSEVQVHAGRALAANRVTKGVIRAVRNALHPNYYSDGSNYGRPNECSIFVLTAYSTDFQQKIPTLKGFLRRHNRREENASLTETDIKDLKQFV